MADSWSLIWIADGHFDHTLLLPGSRSAKPSAPVCTVMLKHGVILVLVVARPKPRPHNSIIRKRGGNDKVAVSESAAGVRRATFLPSVGSRPMLHGGAAGGVVGFRWCVSGGLQSPHPGLFRVLGAPSTGLRPRLIWNDRRKRILSSPHGLRLLLLLLLRMRTSS